MFLTFLNVLCGCFFKTSAASCSPTISGRPFKPSTRSMLSARYSNMIWNNGATFIVLRGNQLIYYLKLDKRPVLCIRWQFNCHCVKWAKQQIKPTLLAVCSYIPLQAYRWYYSVNVCSTTEENAFWFIFVTMLLVLYMLYSYIYINKLIFFSFLSKFIIRVVNYVPCTSATMYPVPPQLCTPHSRNQVPHTLETRYPILSKPYTMYPKLETIHSVTSCTSNRNLTKEWNYYNNVKKLRWSPYFQV